MDTLAPVVPPDRLAALVAECLTSQDTPHDVCFRHAALWRGLPTDKIVAARRPGEPQRTWVRLVAGERVHYFSNGSLRIGQVGRPFQESRHVNGLVVTLTTNKHATKAALRSLGVPVPAGALVDGRSLHPAHAALVAHACGCVAGLNIAAVDTVIGDLAAPPRWGAFWVLEINSSPGLGGYYFPWEGTAATWPGR